MKVTPMQRNKWKHLGYPMHFICRDKCGFRLATLIENKVIVSTVGDFRPDGKNRESLSGYITDDDKMFFETYAFEAAFTSSGKPTIGAQLGSNLCRTEEESYELHTAQCEYWQQRINEGF